TWGYGAMTNSYNDIRNAKTMIIMGGNPAEAHPVSLQHVLEGKELNRANMIVIDPRMTRTAAHATEYVRIRSGTDIPVIWGMLWHVFKNGWEDKEFIRQRVYGMDDIRKEVEKWTPEEVERVSGVPGAQLERVAKMFATEKPSTLIWCMGATQHTVGTANVRAFCVALLATGNVGKFGTGANIFRGHTNVQGATDLGLDIVTLPLYYGLAEGAWKHWCRVWEVDFAWMESRFQTYTGADGKPVKMMNTPGIPSTRWFDATLLPKDQVSQPDNLKAMVIMGHGGNTVTRIPEASAGVDKLDLLVVADPVPTTWAIMGNRKENTYLLPAATSYEVAGSRTASNRSLQWGEQIVKPIFEAKDDNEIMYLLAKKLGLAEGAWRHWCRVWEVDYEWMNARFDVNTGPDGKPVRMMNTPGIPSTRWFDATLLPKDQVSQKDNLKAMVIMGHGGNTVTRIPEASAGVDKLDLLVVADPVPTTWAVMGNRKENTYLLPVATSYEVAGSRTASNRSLQWGEQIVKPIFESKDDNEIMYRLATKLGFADKMFKNIKVENNVPVAEDLLREINRGGWSTGYCGQSPERLKLHMANQKDFDLVTLRASDGPCKGDYYGLPWPCWGTPELKHPGTHTLYNTNLHVMDGGSTFRARFGVERVVKVKDAQGVEQEVRHNLLAEGSYSVGSEIQDGYPEFTYGVLKKLGWDTDLTEAERATIERIGGATPDTISWATDLSGGIQRVAMKHGCMHYGNGKARANAFGLPDAIPVHREPIYTPRPDLVAKYPTLPNARQFRMPNVGFDVQKAAVDKGIAKEFPLILTSGRLVEYEGGGEETRSNKWLAELQQDMFIEINPADAADRGIKDGAWVWVFGAADTKPRARVKALVTERVGKGVTWCPFHFGGWYQGEDQRSKYPKGADPVVLGESVNTLTTYGFDPVTGMQEPKATLCQVRAA
ncbi:MAG TPA: molybdopterin-dependent oxidoreductase, partial [Hyphomicrobiaceae bacterium]